MHHALILAFNALDKRTKRGLLGMFFLSLVGACLEFVGIGLIFPILQMVFNPEEIHTFPVIGGYMHEMFIEDPKNAIIYISVAFLIFFIIKNILVGIIISVQTIFIEYSEAKFTSQLYRSYMNKSYLFHKSKNSADIIRNIWVSSPALFNKLFMPFIQITMEAVILVSLLSVLIAAEPLISVISIALVGTPLVLFYLFIRHRMTSWGRSMEDTNSRMLIWLNQGLGALKDTKILNREQYFIDIFSHNAWQRARHSLRISIAPHFPRLVSEIMVMGAMVGAIVYFSLQEDSIETIIPTLGLFGIAAVRMLPSVNRISHAANVIKSGTPAVENFFEDFHRPSPQDDSEAHVKVPPLPFNRELSIENVSFYYPGVETPALESINLSIEKGAMIGLVGSSGSGKSTLVDLLLGLLPAHSGRICVDGVDIQKETRAWTGNIGFVPQTIYLLDDTLTANIAIGLPKEEIDEDRIHAVLKGAQLDDFIDSQAKGVLTIIGENGIRLSGGQRQRIGIARALYDDPAVLVMDEATSALDNETEQKISHAINQLSGDKTLIIIAHRLSTVRHCDTIVFMENGRIVDQGSFDALNARNPEFQNLVRLSAMDSTTVSS